MSKHIYFVLYRAYLGNVSAIQNAVIHSEVPICVESDVTEIEENLLETTTVHHAEYMSKVEESPAEKVQVIGISYLGYHKVSAE